LESIVLNEGLKSLGEGCFSSCSRLADIVIPSGCENIGGECFSSCRALTGVFFTGNFLTLGNRCFSSCISLLEIWLPDNLTAVPYSAFSFSGLVSISLPGWITSVNSYAFDSAYALAEIHLRGPLSDDWCTALSYASSSSLKVYVTSDSGSQDETFLCDMYNVTIEADSPRPTARPAWDTSVVRPTFTPFPTFTPVPVSQECEGLQYSMSGAALTISGNGVIASQCFARYHLQYCDEPAELCPKTYFVERIVVRPGVTGFTGSEWATSDSIALRELVLPDSILSRGNLDIGDMDGLTTISVGANFVADWTWHWWPSSLTTFSVPANNPHLKVDSGGAVLSNNETILYLYPPGRANKQYTMPQSVTTIAAFAFYEATNLEAVTFSAVKVFELGAFAFCENLRLTALPDSLEYLADYALAGCRLNTSLGLGPLVTLGSRQPLPSAIESFTVSPQHPSLTVDSTGALVSKSKTELVAWPTGRSDSNVVVPNTFTTVMGYESRSRFSPVGREHRRGCVLRVPHALLH
jgi:hypothetical protein